jgi:hypothetical protein
MILFVIFFIGTAILSLNLLLKDILKSAFAIVISCLVLLYCVGIFAQSEISDDKYRELSNLKKQYPYIESEIDIRFQDKKITYSELKEIRNIIVQKEKEAILNAK